MFRLTPVASFNHKLAMSRDIKHTVAASLQRWTDVLLWRVRPHPCRFKAYAGHGGQDML